MKTVIIYDADNFETSDYTVVTVGENSNEICIAGSLPNTVTLCATIARYYFDDETYYHSEKNKCPLYNVELKRLFLAPMSIDAKYAEFTPVWNSIFGETIYIEKASFPPEAIAYRDSNYMDIINQYYHVSLKRLNGPYDCTYRVILTARETAEIYSDEVGENEIKKSSTKVTDTGWIPLELTSDFVPYNNVSSNKPEYRMIGNIVHLRGNVSPVSVITGGSSRKTICTLPEQVRPSEVEYFVVQGSSENIWLLDITGAGEVRFSRYRNGGSYEDASTSAWLPFAVTFFAG